jgi:hypothetical protein
MFFIISRLDRNSFKRGNLQYKSQKVNNKLFIINFLRNLITLQKKEYDDSR